MYRFKSSIFINRPQQEVFDFVSNPANDTQWSSVAESREWTSEGPVGVGSTLRSAARFLGRKIESILEITIWDPPHQYAQKLVSGPFPFEFAAKLEPKENGTQLTINGEIEPGGFFKLAEGLIAKQAQKQLDTDFDALKLLLEEG